MGVGEDAMVFSVPARSVFVVAVSSNYSVCHLVFSCKHHSCLGSPSGARYCSGEILRGIFLRSPLGPEKSGSGR